MYHAEIPGTGQKSVHVDNRGGLTVLAILGPKGGVQARVWLDERQAAILATAITRSYREANDAARR